MGRIKRDDEGVPYVDGRWVDETYQVNGVTLTRTQPEDPAYALLLDGHTSTPNKDIFNDKCYICLDPEFAQMGLPLCYPCAECGGHVAADDTICDVCEVDQQELAYAAAEAACAAEGHKWMDVPAFHKSLKISVVDGVLKREASDEMTEAFTSCERCGVRQDG